MEHRDFILINNLVNLYENVIKDSIKKQSKFNKKIVVLTILFLSHSVLVERRLNILERGR